MDTSQNQIGGKGVVDAMIHMMLSCVGRRDEFVPYLWLKNNMIGKPVEAGRPRMVPKQCANNAIQAVCANGLGWKYVEGYALVHGVPIQHCWNEAPDGRWVDYTIEDPERWEYFGAVIPRSVVCSAVVAKHWSYGVGVLDCISRFEGKKLRLAQIRLEGR